MNQHSESSHSGPKPSVRTIFNEAIEILDPAAQADYLGRACGGDDLLRNKIEALLAADAQAGGFLHPAGADSLVPTLVDLNAKPMTSERIGPYKILEQIGEGGCGVVFLAEQETPIRRRVAIKLIKPGMDTKNVVARFEAERQALALMDHPNIAKVLDAGCTGAGRPYFVMELVRGVRITTYCDEQQLSTRERLKLFAQVCGAVQHAHQKGIIHRDIKPSNVLVTVYDGVPTPKVIDFGIAKATQQPLTDKTIHTAFHQFMGTPAYMSPEQAVVSALDVDTRSDIYSLGVLLYELLTSRTPFETKQLLEAGLDEIRRIIREEEPSKPSTRLSTLGAEDLTLAARCRQADPKRLARLVRGELDWIVMRSMEKDRRRRYETAESLAADVRRYLQDEPVLAGPPDTIYRFGKWLRRHKLLVAAAGASLFTTLAIWVFFLVKVVPVVADNYRTFGAKLPVPVMILLPLSDFMQRNFLFLAVLGCLAMGLVWLRLRKPG